MSVGQRDKPERHDFWSTKTLVHLFPTCEAARPSFRALSLTIHVEASGQYLTEQPVVQKQRPLARIQGKLLTCSSAYAVRRNVVSRVESSSLASTGTLPSAVVLRTIL